MKIPFLEDKDGYIVKVQVKTGANKAGIEGVEEDIIKIKIRAQPYNGLANRELLEILSEYLNVPKSKIEIVKGKTSKHKVVKIKGVIS